MTKFEQRGIQFQYDASNKEQAQKSFAYSCDCCCTKGMRIECDHCAINCTHQMIMAYFDDKLRNTKSKQGGTDYGWKTKGHHQGKETCV